MENQEENKGENSGDQSKKGDMYLTKDEERAVKENEDLGL
jgi:hypothetical protein